MMIYDKLEKYFPLLTEKLYFRGILIEFGKIISASYAFLSSAKNDEKQLINKRFYIVLRDISHCTAYNSNSFHSIKS